MKIKIRFTAPTETYPFYSDIKVNTGNGWRRVLENPTDGRPQGPAIFPTKDEMITKVKRLARTA